MPVMEISIIPVGTKGTSLSDYLVASERALKDFPGITRQISAMGTLLEGPSTSELLRAAEKMHRMALSSGLKRVVTHIHIDERKDKKLSIKGKVESLKRKLKH
jgi:uncharacterized protein (TIGR00106 family)